MPPVINLDEKLALFAEHWQPRIVAGLNDYHLKVAKVEGSFDWHSHPETDEVFMVLAGELTIDFRDGSRVLAPGEVIVVPKGVLHRPHADTECHILLIEPAGTRNTGDNEDSEKTAANDVWI